jgi:ubiquinone/menaquinone biosynthesis C-methylase UbiE
MGQPSIRQAALDGFAASSAYDAHRPSYPPEAVDQLLSALEVSGNDGAIVADLAAGTGKFTELLTARPEQYSIVAIEPHLGMKAELERKSLRGVKVVRGMAEDMSEIADGSFDALVASQVLFSGENSRAQVLTDVNRRSIGDWPTATGQV